MGREVKVGRDVPPLNFFRKKYANRKAVSHMKLQSLTIDDYDQIVQLWTKAGLPFEKEGRDSKQAIETQMKLNPEFFLGAFEDFRLVGVCITSFDGRKGWINHLTVDLGHRRQGIAEALVAEAEKVLERKGVAVFATLVYDSNIASKSLFKKSGYTEHRDIIYFRKQTTASTKKRL